MICRYDDGRVRVAIGKIHRQSKGLFQLLNLTDRPTWIPFMGLLVDRRRLNHQEETAGVIKRQLVERRAAHGCERGRVRVIGVKLAVHGLGLGDLPEIIRDVVQPADLRRLCHPGSGATPAHLQCFIVEGPE